MRCDKMHATIRVTQCLANQVKMSGQEALGGKTHYYPGCKDCSTGADARAGRLNDDDLEQLFEALGRRAHPPAETLPQPVGPVKQTKEDAVKEKETPKEKKCCRCKKTKPLDEFTRYAKALDGHKAHCLACNRIAQNACAQKARARKKAEAAELERLRTGQQAEPAPARESTAPSCPPNEDRILENQLLLDFSPYPEVLAEIKRRAQDEERPPEVEARLMIKRMMHPLGLKRTLVGIDRANAPDRTAYQPVFIDADKGGGLPLVKDLGERQCA